MTYLIVLSDFEGNAASTSRRIWGKIRSRFLAAVRNGMIVLFHTQHHLRRRCLRTTLTPFAEDASLITPRCRLPTVYTTVCETS